MRGRGALCATNTHKSFFYLEVSCPSVGVHHTAAATFHFLVTHTAVNYMSRPLIVRARMWWSREVNHLLTTANFSRDVNCCIYTSNFSLDVLANLFHLLHLLAQLVVFSCDLRRLFRIREHDALFHGCDL